ncbi:hypothetical protein AX16_010309 [Volvariella volvacea WC 439]|nr:hypothetical protein AX16_010309 [Volvariella volvacea WC 439]
MQIPSNMLLNHIGRPSLYLPGCMAVWGAISVLTGFTTNYLGALCTRFLLGFVEAAFFPGALFLISRWYTKRELSERTAILTCGSLLSNAFGSLIASAILDTMEGIWGFAAWRWLFFVEGSITVVVAICSIWILPNFPETPSDWLSPAEQRLAVRRMVEDAQSGGNDANKIGQVGGLKLALTDGKVWWLAIALLYMVISLSFHAYFPTLSATMGYNRTVTLLLCAPPWVFATAVSLAISRHSDRVGERCLHVVIPLCIGIGGFLLAILTMNTAIRYLSLFLMAQSYAGFICFLAWASGSIAIPPAKRAVGLAFINAFSSIGNVIGSYVWPKSWAFLGNLEAGSNLDTYCDFAYYVPEKSRKPFATTSNLWFRSIMVVQSQVRPLTDWSFTQIGGGDGTKDGEWLKVSCFPTTVHVELLKLKRIPDPFIGLHEWDVQWVGESDWAFQSTFDVSEEVLASPHADLVFEGLDTFATVSLNDKVVLNSTNQFIAHRVPVKSLLKIGANTLHIRFESAFLKGRDIEKQHQKLALWNGDSSRLHVRKAQYNYGWDWGPVLMTIGPWKPISLHTYSNRITELDVRSEVSEHFDVKLLAHIEVSDTSENSAVDLILRRPDGGVEVTGTAYVANGKAELSFSFAPGQLDLWYPTGYGGQPLYTVEIGLSKEGNTLDIRSSRIAFRRARVVQEPLVDQEGLSFLFEINNVRVFCGGSNWIPADSFLTTVTPGRYRAWLQLLVDGNQNMIRVWGGGIYEHDAFYDICDVLVWQDFMFGCGQYPAYDSFVESVREEAVQNVKRLRHHPSIVIFAGNNEDYQVAESLHLELDYSDGTSDYRKTNFPARYIYERVLPEVVQKYSDIFYHRASPYSGQGKPTTDRTLGDIHQWNVWHGSQEPWHNWDILAGRFISEFGMQGFPNIRTVDYWLSGNKAERYPQSRTNCNHNKADGFERRLELYLVENFRHSFEMESYVYYTQVMQAETLASAYRLWRRNWRGHGKEYTAGALVWQINDCWPVTSWAIVDYFLRPKPAYFTIARELRPFAVGMTRKEHRTYENDRSEDKFKIETRLEIWGTNSTLTDKKALLEVTAFDLHSEWRETWKKEVTLNQNSSTELYAGSLPGQPVRVRKSDIPKVIIASARLLDEDHQILGRYSNWPEPFKYIQFPSSEEVGLRATVGADGETVTLTTKKPVKGVVLDVEGDDVKWSDQAIDLVPDDPQVVKASGLKGRDIKLRYLGDGTA